MHSPWIYVNLLLAKPHHYMQSGYQSIALQVTLRRVLSNTQVLSTFAFFFFCKIIKRIRR